MGRAHRQWFARGGEAGAAAELRVARDGGRARGGQEAAARQVESGGDSLSSARIRSSLHRIRSSLLRIGVRRWQIGRGCDAFRREAGSTSRQMWLPRPGARSSTRRSRLPPRREAGELQPLEPPPPTERGRGPPAGTASPHGVRQGSSTRRRLPQRQQPMAPEGRGGTRVVGRGARCGGGAARQGGSSGSKHRAAGGSNLGAAVGSRGSGEQQRSYRAKKEENKAREEKK